MARGSVFRHNDTWAIRYDSGVNEQTGARIQTFKSGFESKQDAETRLSSALHEVTTGAHVRVARDTVEAFGEYWLTMLKGDSIRTSSRDRYQDALTFHIVPALGKLTMQKVRAADIRKAYKKWEQQGMAPRSRAQLHTRLRQIFAAAVKEQLIIRNVMNDVEAPLVPYVERPSWTAEQLDTFLRATAAIPFWGTLWHIYGMTGVRRGEALGLQWRDVDWENGRLHIRRQVVRYGAACAFGELKTAASRRTVEISKTTLDVLRAHRTQQVAFQLHADTWESLDLVFARQPQVRGHVPGSMLRPDVVSSYWTQTLERFDAPRINLHGLRHTHASILLRVDGNIKAIAARLGHDPVVLLRTYAHIVAGDQALAVSRFEAALAMARQPVPQSTEIGS